MAERLPEMTTRVITREQLQAMYPAPKPIQPEEAAALDRLLAIARTDTGQARRVAAFLLAWWNAGTCGGFDLTDLRAVDTAIAADMQTVFALIARVHSYPDALGFDGRIEPVMRQWRPQLQGGNHD